MDRDNDPYGLNDDDPWWIELVPLLLWLVFMALLCGPLVYFGGGGDDYESGDYSDNPSPRR